MGLSRNKVAVSEGAAGSPPFYGERVIRRDRYYEVLRLIDGDIQKIRENIVVQYSVTDGY